MEAEWKEGWDGDSNPVSKTQFQTPNTETDFEAPPLAASSVFRHCDGPEDTRASKVPVQPQVPTGPPAAAFLWR